MNSSHNNPTLREQLDSVRPDSDDLREPEVQEAARAIADSDEWQEVFARQQSLDREVAEVMQSVEVPEGLQSRLLDTLAAARDEQPADVSSAGPNEPLHRRTVLQWGALAAGLLLAVAAGLYLSPRDGSQITLDEARHLIPTADDGTIDTTQLPAFDSSFTFMLPDPAWSRTTYMSEEIRGLDWAGDARHDGAIYEFHVDGQIHGYLLVLPASRLSHPPTSTILSMTGIDYHPVANSAWVDPTTNLAYVCFVDQGDLSQLQRRLYPHSA